MDGWNFNQKRFLRHWRKKQIKTWYLVVALLVGLSSSVYWLRSNNLKMVELRSAVIAADEQAGDVAGSLVRLNEHVFKHINTKIVRPIELVGAYSREAQAVIEAATQTSGRDIYAEAAAACERRGIPLTSIAQCAADYAAANNPGVAQKEIVLPDKNRFIYTFVSPRWTPDAAGFSLLATGLIAIWLTGRMGEYLAVRWIIRRRQNRQF